MFSIWQKIYLSITAFGDPIAKSLIQRRIKNGKEDTKRIQERFGNSDLIRPDGTLIWLHAASVGETMSLLDLIALLGNRHSTWHFLITTGTKSSAEMLLRRMPNNAIHQYIPIDTKTAVQNFLSHWKPDLAVWTESELWPRLMYETKALHIPMLLLNGRMSESSRRAWRFAPNFAKSIISSFDYILAQDAISANRFITLGALENKIEVTGSMKEAATPLPCNENERKALSRMISGRPVWLASSTHLGEEQSIIEAHMIAQKTFHNLLLILAPRHPERANDILELISNNKLSVKQKSKNAPISNDTDIYLADTIGDLGLWYRLAPVSFVGGSLVDIGGHNPFEPAALGSAIIHGPYVQNFHDIYARFKQADAAVEVTNSQDFSQQLITLLAPNEAAEQAMRAWEVCSESSEITDKAISRIEQMVKSTC